MRIFGDRMVKTALAVCVTALICLWLDWPPVFAVITAIVTIEPTVTDSIKKGLVRFPASAIGSFYAVLFISFFGNSALTYTLAATLTIATCYRLKLHAGLLVATITSVAMIEVIHDQYIMAFIIRLGTTSIGLVVSILVNMFIFPPNYQKVIEKNFQAMLQSLGQALQAMTKQESMTREIMDIKTLLTETRQLILYELDETNFRPFMENKEEDQIDYLQKLKHIELIYYHLQNIADIHLDRTAFSQDEKQRIIAGIEEIVLYLLEGKPLYNFSNIDSLQDILHNFWRSNHDKETFTHSLLADELILLYEIISIYALMEKKQAPV